MKKLLLDLLILLLVFSLVACGSGSYVEPINPGNNNNDPSDGEPGDTSGDENEEAPYTVSFTLNGLKYVPEDPITVKWTKTEGSEVHTATTDSDGVASVTGLDGNYRVTVSGLPAGLTYNPNDTKQIAKATDKDVAVNLYKLVVLNTLATGSNVYGDVIEISDPGVYRIKVTKSDPNQIYYQYVPRNPGVYTVESWLDVTENVVDPVAYRYEGSVAYKNMNEPIPCDDGGASSTYTKNFVVEMEVFEDSFAENGAGSVVFCFGISATRSDGIPINEENPIYIDIILKYEREPEDNRTTADLIAPTELPDDNSMRLYIGESVFNVNVPADSRSWESFLNSSYTIAGTGKYKSVAFTLLDYESLYGIATVTYQDGGTNATKLSTYYFTCNDGSLELEHLSGEDIEPRFEIAHETIDWYEMHYGYTSAPLSTQALAYNKNGLLVLAEKKTVTAADGSAIEVDMIRYNPEDGYYHLYDANKYTVEAGYDKAVQGLKGFGNGYGPILYAYITQPCLFLDVSFSQVEYRGNHALTVTSAENYKLFIEGYEALLQDPPGDDGPYFCILGCPCRESGRCDGACTDDCDKCNEDCRRIPTHLKGQKGYADYANADGLCPVTEELKQFLQKYATSQLLFRDGNGLCEQFDPRFDAAEGDQWLFACTYYNE